MNLLRALLPAAALLASCDSRFNAHGLLVKEPVPTEIAGTYSLDSSSVSSADLKEMGYPTVNSTVVLHPDFSFVAIDLPGCCVHGWDERTYPFTGGSYQLSGTWEITKQKETYGVNLKVAKIAGAAAKPPSDPELADQRKSPASIDVVLLESPPLALGFPVFSGDFSYIAFAKKSAAAK